MLIVNFLFFFVYSCCSDFCCCFIAFLSLVPLLFHHSSLISICECIALLCGFDVVVVHCAFDLLFLLLLTTVIVIVVVVIALVGADATAAWGIGGLCVFC